MPRPRSSNLSVSHAMQSAFSAWIMVIAPSRARRQDVDHLPIIEL